MRVSVDNKIVKDVEPVSGIVVELNRDDAANLSAALYDYRQLLVRYGSTLGGLHTCAWSAHFEKMLEYARQGINLAGALVLCLLCTSHVVAQTTTAPQTVTLTNADLNKPHAAVLPITPAQLASLKAHEYRLPVEYRGPSVFSTNTKGPTLGPWEFPAERPARRLDGTLLSDPPTVLGLPWWYYVQNTSHQHRGER